MKTEPIAKITYNQYKRLKALSVDQLMDKHFLPVEGAINIFNECKRIHSIECGPLKCPETTASWINRKIEAMEVTAYE
tara:strand:+ start:193 stop:426 length:234 start_codon:yes stop_codon:yes gene_type:complete